MNSVIVHAQPRFACKKPFTGGKMRIARWLLVVCGLLLSLFASNMASLFVTRPTVLEKTTTKSTSLHMQQSTLLPPAPRQPLNNSKVSNTTSPPPSSSVAEAEGRAMVAITLAASNISNTISMPTQLPPVFAQKDCPFSTSDVHEKGQMWPSIASMKGRMLVVNEAIPCRSEGGGVRSREVLRLTSHTFDARPWLAVRIQQNDSCCIEELTQGFGARFLKDSASPSSYALSDSPPPSLIFGHVFSSPTVRSIDRVANFSALVERITAPGEESTVQTSDDDGDSDGGGGGGDAQSVRIALLFMWSFLIAPSGDPHWTIPELFLPLMRAHLPDTCTVVVADDLQHRRFRIESMLSAESAQRLQEREMAAYLQADGVFFVSREDRDEVERQLLRRRHSTAPNSTAAPLVAPLAAPLPLLLTLPYVGENTASPLSGATFSKEHSVNPIFTGSPPLLLFVGSATHSNEKAVSWLVHKVLPHLLESDPSLELTLVGRRRRQYLMRGVSTIGFVDDLDELVANASVLLLPSFVESGVSTKILLGIQGQVPVVTTSTGRRGIWHASDTLPAECLNSSEGPLIVRDDPAEYAAATLTLLRSRNVYFGAQRCIRAFGAQLNGEQQQRQVVEQMRDHCHRRHKERIQVQMPLQRYAATLPPLPMLVSTTHDNDSADAPMRLAKNMVWHGEVQRQRALDLTVLTSFVDKDSEFVDGWLLDIARQEALDVYAVEVVVSCFEEVAYDAFVVAIKRRLGELAKLARVSVCLFSSDPGIYGMWDAIIQRPACAPIVTNWNVDDRKSPFSLLERMNMLAANPSVSAVTAGVLLFNDSNYTWAQRNSTYTLRLFDLEKSRPLGIEDMFVFHWKKTKMTQSPDEASKAEKNPLEPFIHGSHNVPHNSPMWRRTMHLDVGGFNPMDGLGCYDFSFWLRVLRRGFRIEHLNEPLEMYLERATSHGHRTHAWASPRWEDHWVNECDDKNTWTQNALLATRAATLKRFKPSNYYWALQKWRKGQKNEWRHKQFAWRRKQLNCTVLTDHGPHAKAVNQLRSPNGKMMLYIQHGYRICVAPYTQALARQPRPPVELVFDATRHKKRVGHLCMHPQLPPRTAMAPACKPNAKEVLTTKPIWCTWMCKNCQLGLSNEGRFYWSNGTYTYHVFSWKDRMEPSRFFGKKSTCWSPPRVHWDASMTHVVWSPEDADEERISLGWQVAALLPKQLCLIICVLLCLQLCVLLVGCARARGVL